MPLLRVDVRQAGAEALGILVPPGARTVVVLRPRMLGWDLLPVRWSGNPAEPPAFCSFGREEAAHVARHLGKCLEDWDARGACPVETLGHDNAFLVWLSTEELGWLLCVRAPGSNYRPLVFADLPQAQAAAERLVASLLPGPSRQQHYYFNTQNFAS